MGVNLAGNTEQFITQGVGLPNQGGQPASSKIFDPHVWPFPSSAIYTASSLNLNAG